ncbi:undecaprenyl-diphosphatase [bacterium BMS3Abin02]|nr:undecaprenyl-diphosphatase [bacterium BMS3Abin02]GBE23150.1 undecaprenyl-diphosphatase [bacterium BMS3Bbin01]HDH27241.1 undecaprenyl-diphosphate phosphatase [Actinomycetota bacterium]
MDGRSARLCSGAVLQAILWGLIQGLTEFLPVSSSGHLVLVPAMLGVDPPDLATTAVLHLGTLIAVLTYYRRDIAALLRFDDKARHLWWLLIVGTLPALIGLALKDQIDTFQRSYTLVAIALLVSGAVLLASQLIHKRTRTVEEETTAGALVIGIAQALAMVPGISRSGMTITAGLGRGLDAEQAARYSFLLAIPAIAGGGLLEAVELSSAGSFTTSVWVAMVVAAVSGYLAIAFLIRVLVKRGLVPFAIYSLAVGAVALILL